MNSLIRNTIGASLTAAAVVATAAGPEASDSACKAIHAVMIEQRVTEGCKPGHTFCFIGEVAGNHDMRGATYFKGDSSGTGRRHRRTSFPTAGRSSTCSTPARSSPARPACRTPAPAIPTAAR